MTISLALAAAAPVRAETRLELDGAMNLNYSATTGGASTEGGAAPEGGGFFADLRPGIALQAEGRRLVWRIGYVFSGTLSLEGSQAATYGNHVDLSVAALLSKRSTMTLTLSGTQGGTAFQLSQRAAEDGQPAIRAPTNPELIAATAGEALVWQASPDLNLTQGLGANLSAPQDEPSELSATLTGSLGLDWLSARNAIGGELRSNASLLQPPVENEDPYWSVTNSLVARWRRDLGERWSGQAVLGVQQVITFALSYPLAILPTGGLSASYTHGRAAAGLDLTHGATVNLQTGTVGVTDQAVARGALTFGPISAPRVLSASAGFLHTEPLGQSAGRAAAGVGDAVQADAGFAWSLSETLAATVRYSLGYQLNQGAALEPSLAHVLLVGVTARYRSGALGDAPLPSLGRRVDGADATGF